MTQPKRSYQIHLFPALTSLIVMIVGWELSQKLDDLKMLMQGYPKMQEQINSIDYRLKMIESKTLSTQVEGEKKSTCILWYGYGKTNLIFDRNKLLIYNRKDHFIYV